MSLTTVNTTELALVIALVVVLVACIAALLVHRKRRTERLRTRFGGAEYARAVEQDGNRRHAEAGLEERRQRVEGLYVRPLAEGDRARFVETWRGVQARFVDGPAGAVTEADQLLSDVMSTRGYPVSDFEQRAADISVDHPLILENYRTAHRNRVSADAGAGQHGRLASGDGSLSNAFRRTGQRARNRGVGVIGMRLPLTKAS